MLEGLYRMQGDAANAGTAGSHVADAAGPAAGGRDRDRLFADGDLEPAEELIRAYLLRHGDHIEAMRLLARIGIARKVYLMPSAARGGAGARARLSRRAPRLRLRTHRAASLLEARAELDKLLASDPTADSLRLYAATCVGLGEHERAIGSIATCASGRRRMPRSTSRSRTP